VIDFDEMVLRRRPSTGFLTLFSFLRALGVCMISSAS